jgi:hypothetical protein
LITVIARWDTVQMASELEWRVWRQLRGAFEVDEFIFVGPALEGSYSFTQVATVSDALALLPEGCQRVFLEPGGSKTVAQVPSGDVAIIVGNTDHSNAEHAQPDELYGILSPMPTDLYGFNAAAIALALRYGQ